jgi:hypothetical protein
MVKKYNFLDCRWGTKEKTGLKKPVFSRERRERKKI